MELKPHYLLQIRGMNDLVIHGSTPSWVPDSLEVTPFVVVRRAGHENKLIPIGIRGKHRGQRFAAWLPQEHMMKVITPYLLRDAANWKIVYNEYTPTTIQTLKLVTPLLQMIGYRWGPTGSAGFELATGTSVLNNSSDLDLVIDTPMAMSRQLATALMNSLEKIALVPLDIQMNIPGGSVSLKEYITSETVLVKTPTGPVLQHIKSLWY